MNVGWFIREELAWTIEPRVGPAARNRHLSFGTTRNRWDRIVRLCSKEARKNRYLNPWRRLLQRGGLPVDEIREARAIFRRLVQGDWRSNGDFCVIDGQFRIDYVMRYDHLACGQCEACGRGALPVVTLPRLKSDFRRKEMDYSRYYDEENRAVVGE